MYCILSLPLLQYKFSLYISTITCYSTCTCTYFIVCMYVWIHCILLFSYVVAFPFIRAFFGRSTSPILLDDVRCFGNESSLLDCTVDRNTCDCGHFEDAGVRCYNGECVTTHFLVYIYPSMSSQSRGFSPHYVSDASVAEVFDIHTNHHFLHAQA